MQYISLEVVVAVLIFFGLTAFMVLVYASMRTLFGRAAHAIARIASGCLSKGM